MALQEEETRCSNSSGGDKKKHKQKKIPQRGLGVARLEKLRMEEQQKKNAAASSSSALRGTSSFPSQQPTHPFWTITNDPDPMSGPVVNPDPIFRHSEAVSNLFNTTQLQLLENSAVGSGNPGHGFLPMLWNTMESSPLNAEAQTKNLGFRTSLNDDTLIPGWRSSGLLQRRQSHFSSISAVNKRSRPSSSGVSPQMEPPSNQSYTTGDYDVSSSRPGEKRVVGMKRSWSFDLDGVAGYNYTSFPSKIPSRNFTELETKTIYSRKRFGELDNGHEENGGCMDGGFLSLGASSSSSVPKPKQPTVIQAPTRLDYPEFSSFQGSMSAAIPSSQPPFYCFLPMRPNGCEKTLDEQGRGREALEGVDLKLKL